MGILEKLFGKKEAGSWEPKEISDLIWKFAAERDEIPTIHRKDDKYTDLSFNDLRGFVYKHYDPRGLSYRKDFPDCDDYAAIALSDVIRGAIRERMRYLPPFGVVTFTKESGGRHQMNFAVTKDKGLMFFEANGGKWREPSDIKGTGFSFDY